jgi:hypothetical protein
VARVHVDITNDAKRGIIVIFRYPVLRPLLVFDHSL